MDEFSYLSVLLAVILGLAITQILQGLRGLAHSREHVTIYWPSLVWAGLVFLIAVQSWWASFGMRHITGWTFLGFTMVLLENTCIYLIAALVLPDFPEGRHVDLRQSYFKQVPWFFGLFMLLLVFSVLKDAVLGGTPNGLNLAFHGLFFAGSIAMIAIRNETFHKVYTVFTVGLIVTYIFTLFGYLH